MEVSHGRWLFISHLSRILKRVGLSTSIVGDCIHDLTALSFERLASKHSGPQAVIIGTCAPTHVPNNGYLSEFKATRGLA